MANRHLSRTVAMQSLYVWDFNNQDINLTELLDENIKNFAPGLDDTKFVHDLVFGVEKNVGEIDKIIIRTAPEWPLEQINLVDRNILRLGILELMFLKEVPPKVAINEAVELGKVFGGESSGKFINGVLGTLYRNLTSAGDASATTTPKPAVTSDAKVSTEKFVDKKQSINFNT